MSARQRLAALDTAASLKRAAALARAAPADRDGAAASAALQQRTSSTFCSMLAVAPP
jgi:hypothetical protein